MGVRSIPSSWVQQARPGGLIVATLRGWMRSLGLVRLAVDGDRTASGRFLSSDPSFMIARQQDAPESLGMLPAPDEGTTRGTPHDPKLLTTPDSGFVSQLALPNARYFSMPADDGTVSTYVLDATNDAFAVAHPTAKGGPCGRAARRCCGTTSSRRSPCGTPQAPPPDGVRGLVAPDVQRVWLGTPEGPSWLLPA